MEVPLTNFMMAISFLLGMIFVWAFGIAHDLIINWYRKAIYARELEKEKRALANSAHPAANSEKIKEE